MTHDSSHNNSSIYLVGFMASGKTYWGRQWAKELGYTFLDLDEEIEAVCQKSIDLIFKEEGEAAFRKIEQRLLKETLSIKQGIIAAGGGAAAYEDNMAWMCAHGRTIYLKADADTLAKRILADEKKRPIVEGISADRLTDFISRKLIDREPFYKQAAIVADASKLTTHWIREYLKG